VRNELYSHLIQAKVVLVERDIESWAKSFESVIESNYTWMARVMRSVFDPYFSSARPATTMLKVEYAMFSCNDQASFSANARDTYRKHYAKVRSLVPKDRVLEYKLGSGWEPLCEFLDKPVPSCEFPFKNEKKEFAIWMRKTQIRVLTSAALGVFSVPGMTIVVALAGYAIHKAGWLM
jgi:hypothetical protein